MESQSIVVSESENVGNLVAMIQAEDPDSDTLWYSISGNVFYSIIIQFEILFQIILDAILDRLDDIICFCNRVNIPMHYNQASITLIP